MRNLPLPLGSHYLVTTSHSTFFPNMRILALSDIQGNWDAFNKISQTHQNLKGIVHTGNFGFWTQSTVESATDLNYLKQIVAFLEVLPKNVVDELNDLSTLNNAQDPATAASVLAEFKQRLLQTSLFTHLKAYLNGDKVLPCPVYTTIGALDDPYTVEKFTSGEWSVPGLNIIDHEHSYLLEPDSPDIPPIRLYGLGGNVKVHSLFDSGKLGLKSVAGKVGDLWITLAQVAQLYLHMDQASDKTINIFVSHSPVMKNPLLEHVAIMTGADYTISQGLHFRYPVSGNGMSFVDSMGGLAGYIENYRLKFSRLRMILGELWVIIKDDVAKVLQTSLNSGLRDLIELGLSIFDKIPITISESTEKIVRLSLNDEEDDDESFDVGKQTLKKINDMYFSAYYNLWHFSLCDYMIKDEDENDEEEEFNVVVLRLKKNGTLALQQCNSSGFSFRARDSSHEIDEVVSQTSEEDPSDDALRRTKDLLSSTYKEYRSRGKGFGSSGKSAIRGGFRPQTKLR